MRKMRTFTAVYSSCQLFCRLVVVVINTVSSVLFLQKKQNLIAVVLDSSFASMTIENLNPYEEKGPYPTQSFYEDGLEAFGL